MKDLLLYLVDPQCYHKNKLALFIQLIMRISQNRHDLSYVQAQTGNCLSAEASGGGLVPPGEYLETALLCLFVCIYEITRNGSKRSV
jgi:hypothetical protein